MRPTAAAIEGCADITGKWAKKAEKEYDAVNAEAGKYFSLLAVSSRLSQDKASLIDRKRPEATMHTGQELVDDMLMQVSSLFSHD